MRSAGSVSWRAVGGLCAAAASLAVPCFSSAALVVVGDIQSPVLRGVGGLAFDGHRNPLVIGLSDPAILRINRSSADVMQTYIMPDPAGSRGLAWDNDSTSFYTGELANGLDELFRLRLPASNPFPRPSVTQLTRNIGQGLDALDFETSNSGSIWYLTSDDGGEIVRMDKLRGQGVVEQELHGKLGTLASFARGPDGNFYVATDGDAHHHARIYQVNAQTGRTRLAMDLGTRALHVVDIDFDPLSKRWWGVVEPHGADTQPYQLVKFTTLPTGGGGPIIPPTVPEPASGALTAAGVGMLALWRRRRRIPHTQGA